MREKIASDLTAQYVCTEMLKENDSELKYSGLDETELKWNSGQRRCYPACSFITMRCKCVTEVKKFMRNLCSYVTQQTLL